MSRSRRAKKQTNLWPIVMILVCVLVVGGTFYMLHDINSKVTNLNTNNTINTTENIIQNEINENTTVPQNVVNQENTIENESVNEIKNTTTNIANNTAKQTDSTSNKTSTISNTPAIPAVTDDKQKAIELVKKDWGEDASVSFSFDYINEKGEYVVAVKDKASATVKCYFRVNLSNGTVELD